MSDPGSNHPGKSGRSFLRINVKTLMVMVSTSALLTWSARSVWEISTESALVRALRTGSTAERRNAAHQLDAFPRPAEVDTVVGTLTLGMHDEDDEVRRESVISLGSVLRQLLISWEKSPGELSKKRTLITQATRAIILLLKDRNDELKTEALRTLLAIHISNTSITGEPLPTVPLPGIEPDGLRATILPMLSNQSRSIRSLATEVLARLGPSLSSDIPPELVAALDDDSAEVRDRAAWACDCYKDKLSPLLPDLFARLEQARPPVRYTLWECLERGTADPALVPFLRERLKRPSPDVRSAAAALLAGIGPAAVPATPELLSLLTDPFVPEPVAQPPFVKQPDPAKWAAKALTRFPPTPCIIKSLAANLASPVLDRRNEALWRLIDLGYAYRDSNPALAQHALPALITLYRERMSNKVLIYGIPRAMSIIASGTKYADAVIAVLIEALQSREPDIRNEAAEGIGSFGRRAKAAIPLLKRLAAEPGSSLYVERALMAIEQGRPLVKDAWK